MIGDRIRALRQARCWTQAHLAEAAGLSLRTVQRLEREGACGSETLLALAAAFGVDVSTLRGGGVEPAHDQPLWRAPKRALLWAALLCLPCVLFVGLNLLKYGAGYAGPFDAFAVLGDAAGLSPAFRWLSPPLLLGGPVVAVGLVLASRVQLRGRRDGPALTVRALHLRIDAAGALVAVTAGGALAILLAYLVSENPGHLVRSAAHAVR